MIVIKADKVPPGEHAGRYNAPTVNEVAIIMVGDTYGFNAEITQCRQFKTFIVLTII